MFEYFLFSGSSRETLQLHIFLEVSQNPIRLWGWTPQEGNPYSYSVWIFYGFVRPSLTSLTNPTVTRGFAREQWAKIVMKTRSFSLNHVAKLAYNNFGEKKLFQKIHAGPCFANSPRGPHYNFASLLQPWYQEHSVEAGFPPRAGGKTHGWKPKITGGFGLMVSP